MGNILFVSPVKWSALKQRHQGFAIELAKAGNKVLFLNPFESNGFSLTVAEEYKNIKIINVKVPFKASSFPLLQRFSVKSALFLILKKLGLNRSDFLLWLAEPCCAEMVEYKWKKIFYDCCDLHGAFPGQKFHVWQNYQENIAKKADLIMVSHKYLGEQFRENIQKKILLVPNATSYTTKPRIQKICFENKLKLLSSGAHYGWLDMDWLKMLADLENTELHIAGLGRGKAFKELISMKNVIFHGALEQDKLLELMHKCHVGLVPFKDIELIKGVDPIKVYDYASQGLEIWAPDIDSLKSNKYISLFLSDRIQAQTAVYSLLKRMQTRFSYKLDSISLPTWSSRLSLLHSYF